MIRCRCPIYGSRCLLRLLLFARRVRQTDLDDLAKNIRPDARRFLFFFEDDLGQRLRREIGAGDVVGDLNIIALADEASNVCESDVVACFCIVQLSI